MGQHTSWAVWLLMGHLTHALFMGGLPRRIAGHSAASTTSSPSALWPSTLNRSSRLRFFAAKRMLRFKNTS